MSEQGTAPGPERQFRDYLKQGRFMIQRSRGSGEHVFYPRTMTPGEGSTDLEWVEAGGGGTVYATTVVRQRPEKGGIYNVALIDLDEGARLMSRVEGVAPDNVRIGMRVRARIAEQDGEPILLFDAAAE